MSSSVLAAKAYADAAVDALKAHNNDEAIVLAEKSLALQENVNTLFILGVAYTNVQKYSQAVSDLQSAKAKATAGNADSATLNAIDKALANAYDRQAVVAMQAGNSDEAVVDLEKAARAVPSRAVFLYTEAANVLAKVAKPDWKAVKIEADKALVIDPNDARANYVAGIALIKQGHESDAMLFLQRAKANVGSGNASLSASIGAALKTLGQ